MYDTYYINKDQYISINIHKYQYKQTIMFKINDRGCKAISNRSPLLRPWWPNHLCSTEPQETCHEFKSLIIFNQ